MHASIIIFPRYAQQFKPEHINLFFPRSAPFFGANFVHIAAYYFFSRFESIISDFFLTKSCPSERRLLIGLFHLPAFQIESNSGAECK
jgi:hypothetical protein